MPIFLAQIDGPLCWAVEARFRFRTHPIGGGGRFLSCGGGFTKFGGLGARAIFYVSINYTIPLKRSYLLCNAWLSLAALIRIVVNI